MKIDFPILPIPEQKFWSRVLKQLQIEFLQETHRPWGTFDKWLVDQYSCKLLYERSMIGISGIDIPEERFMFMKLKFSN